MLRHIGKHELYLATLFGKYSFEVEPMGCANPWIQQYHDDIQALCHLDGMAWVCETIDASLLGLINNNEIREQFVDYDLSELRASELLA